MEAERANKGGAFNVPHRTHCAKIFCGFLVGRALISSDPIGAQAETAETFHADLGGSSANICVGLSKLGCASALVTSVSDDVVGRFCANRLQHYDVETQYVTTTSRRSFRTSLAVYESRLEDFPALFIYRNNAVDFQVSDEDVEKVSYGDYGALITAGTIFASEPSRARPSPPLNWQKEQACRSSLTSTIAPILGPPLRWL